MKEYKTETYILYKGYKPFNQSIINDDINWNFEKLTPLLQDVSFWFGKLNSLLKCIQPKKQLSQIELKEQEQLSKMQLLLSSTLNRNCVMIGMK